MVLDGLEWFSKRVIALNNAEWAAPNDAEWAGLNDHEPPTPNKAKQTRNPKLNYLHRPFICHFGHPAFTASFLETICFIFTTLFLRYHAWIFIKDVWRQ
jgi:hypothetical protein